MADETRYQNHLLDEEDDWGAGEEYEFYSEGTVRTASLVGESYLPQEQANAQLEEWRQAAMDEGQAWYVKGMEKLLPRLKASLLQFAQESWAISGGNNMLSCEALHLGENPQGIRLEASFTGDWGIYQEMRISAFKGEACIGDVLVGLNDKGELRVLVTTDSDGDNEHPVAVFPQRRLDDAVEIDMVSPRPTHHESPKA